MGDQNTPASEVTETVSPAAAADTQPAVAAPTSTPAAPIATPDNQVTAEAAAENAWFAKEGDAVPATSEQENEPEPQTATATTPAAAKPTTAEALDPDVLKVLQRAHVTPENYSKWSEGDRLRFLTNQIKIQSHFDRVFGERQQQPAPQQNQQPPVQQGQQPPQQPTNDPFAKLEEEFGADYAAPHRAAYNALAAQLEQQKQISQQMLARQAWSDFDEGLKGFTAPAGVDLTQPATKAAIMQRVAAIAQAEGKSFEQAIGEGYLRHAVPQAAASLYHKEITAAQSEQQQAANRKKLAGSPTRTSTIPKTRTEVPKDQDEAEANWLREHAA